MTAVGISPGTGAAASACSERVYRVTIWPSRQRPCSCTTGIAAPRLTMVRAMPTRPLCPVYPLPSPAARAAARMRLLIVSPVILPRVEVNTGASGSTSAGLIAASAAMADGGRYTIAVSPVWSVFDCRTVNRPLPSVSAVTSRQSRAAASERRSPAVARTLASAMSIVPRRSARLAVSFPLPAGRG